jgi:hypothetical protein
LGLASLGDRYVANRNAVFRYVFNAAVGFEDRAPEQDSCYKFRDRWISGPPAPPARPLPTFSVACGRAENPNSGGPSRANLRTGLEAKKPVMGFLRPSFSKPGKPKS